MIKNQLLTTLFLLTIGMTAVAAGDKDAPEQDHAYSLEELSEMSYDEVQALTRGGGLNVCIAEGFPATYTYYDLVAVTGAPGVPWTLTGTADWFGSFGITWLWDVAGTYDPVTKTVDITVTNPFPDGCISVSGQFDQTGVLTGPNFAGTGVNDCGITYSWTGRGRGGNCPTGVSPRLIDGQQAAGGAASAKEISAEVAINTYPNPTSDYAMVNLNSVIGEQISVEAYDASGRLVANILNGEATSGGAYWDVSGQPNGIYLIRVSAESFTKTLTVQVQH